MQLKFFGLPALAVLGFCATSASASTVVYTNAAAYNLAVSGSSDFNFASVAVSGTVTNGPATVGGVTFDTLAGSSPHVAAQNAYNPYVINYGSSFFFGQGGPSNSTVSVTLPGGVTSVGFTYGASKSLANFTFALSNGDTVPPLTGPPSILGSQGTNFIGFTSTTPITSVSFAADSNTIVITDFKRTPLQAVPLPAAAWLLLSGLGGIAGFARRKSA